MVFHSLANSHVKNVTNLDELKRKKMGVSSDGNIDELIGNL